MEQIHKLELVFLCEPPIHSFQYGDKIEWKIITDNTNIYTKLIECKNKIEQLYISESWDRAKKVNNDFELIYLPNKRIRKESIAKYEPLSRAFFKMWELLHLFNHPLQINPNNSICILGLAEGPGGFIEAMNYWREKYNPKIVDDICGITLRSTNKDIPGWKKTKKFLNENKHITIDYGADNTGNIYNINNIEYLFNKYNHSVDLVTADGGFDFSDDFNYQEQKSYRIIFCESVIALATLNVGGMFICKIFDIFSRTTVSILQMLKAHFKKVTITKPHTSRPCNSEKYIVCEHFMGIDSIYLKKCFLTISLWSRINNNKSFVTNIFNENNLDQNLLDTIDEFNKINAEQQIFHIEKTLESIINKTGNSKKLNIQRKKAVEWCEAYNITINKNSKFLKK